MDESRRSIDGDRLKDLKAFDDTKTGVKGLIDSGITSLPKIFVRPPKDLLEDLKFGYSMEQIPVIDLGGIGNADQHTVIVDQLRRASEEWGFFQAVNHGIPATMLDGMMDGIRKFHEQDAELKKDLYSRERRTVKYQSNVDLYQSPTADWRDTMTIDLTLSDKLQPNELPEICRTAAIEYIAHVTKLGETLFELLSEALGLKLQNLKDMNCAPRVIVCHYYPACPEPELTLGIKRHTDPGFITILLQNQIGGLECLHNNQWTQVPPIPGGLIVNIGDMLQIVSNDKFKSAEHRVISNKTGPRISVACFFNGADVPGMTYGPAKELISEENPPIYRECTVAEYITQFLAKSMDVSTLDYFKI